MNLWARNPDFKEINRRHLNLSSGRVRCRIDMKTDSRDGVQSSTHEVVFGQNNWSVLTNQANPSARLLNKFLKNLAPFWLSNLLPDTQTADFHWNGKNLVYFYAYKGFNSENTYFFRSDSALESIEIKTNDGVKQLRMEFSWGKSGQRFRIEKFVNHQYRHGISWEMIFKYGSMNISGFPVPDAITVKIIADGKAINHLYNFSQCTLP